MTREDRDTLTEIIEQMFLLIHTKCEIATLTVKNQAAPKYLHNQAVDLQARILNDVSNLVGE